MMRSSRDRAESKLKELQSQLQQAQQSLAAEQLTVQELTQTKKLLEMDLESTKTQLKETQETLEKAVCTVLWVVFVLFMVV